MTSQSTNLATTLCNLAVNLPSGGFLPKTTLTGAVAAGATTLPVTDIRPFLTRCIVSFWDGTAELPLSVLSVSPTGHTLDAAPLVGTITLDFTGQAYTSLQYAHASGALIATNVVDAMPVSTDAMLQNGFPVLAAFVLDRRDRMPGNHFWSPTMVLSICYQLPATQPETSAMHEQLWVRQQVLRCEKDMDTLVTYLETQNFTFKVGSVSAAEYWTQADRSLRNNISNIEMPLWELYADLTVIGSEIDMVP